MKFIPRRGQKRGLPPGTLVHIGADRDETTRITLVDYDETKVQVLAIEDLATCLPFKELPSVTWLHIEGVHNLEPIQQLGEYFGLHALVLEDIMNTEQRPKIEAFDDYLYIVLKLLTYDVEKEEVLAEQVSLIVGSNFVLSFEEGPLNDVFSTVRDRIQHNRGRIKKMDADYLA
ncbi:MAG: magnesium transporter [Candidatus Latescibacterota bacterium]|jgi:magnesium transporter